MIFTLPVLIIHWKGIFLHILPNDSRNQPDRHIPVLINPGDDKTDFILLSGHPVIIATVSHSIDADVKANKDGAFVDVGDNACRLALNLALAKVCLTGVAVHAFDICLHGNVLKGIDFYVQDTDQNLFSYMKAFRGVPKPVP